MELAQILNQVDALKAEIDALRPINPEQEQRIMQKFRLEWTYHSNAIEGNTLTFGETKAFLLHGVTAQGKPFRDYLDIRGHHAAIDSLLEIVRQQAPLTEAAVRELHKIILVEPYDVDAVTQDGRPTKRRVIPGQYKSMPNHVHTSTGEVHYYANPEETPAKIADLMAWYRRELDKGDLHPLILAATFHYQFVTIHPFDDGNGRMARLLMNLILMQAGFPPVVVQLDTKNEYLLALEQADTDDDLTPFIEIIGKSLLNSPDLYLRGAKGEDIEEIQDLDKKLTILQKRIDAEKEQLGPERNSNSLVSFYNRILTPFWVHFHSQMSKFRSFFHDSEIEVFYDNTRSNISEYDVLSMLRKKIIDAELKKMRIAYQLDKFTTDESFKIIAFLYIQLEQFEFEIRYQLFPHNSAKLLLKDRYDALFSDEDIQKRLLNLTNEIYEIIERKTNSL